VKSICAPIATAWTAKLERVVRTHPFVVIYLAAALVAWAIVLGIR
jgi:hypothetical protein